MYNGEDWSGETYAAAERAIGYTFRDKALLLTCFTHTSYANALGGADNERLEFLGDAVLQLAVTETLFAMRGEDEGRLTELRKQYVSRSALEQAERRAGLMRFLRYSGGEHNISGKTPSNLFEAVVAGLYLDGGMPPVKEFLGKFLAEIGTENYKTLLQEYVQERTKEPPRYFVREAEEGYICTAKALGKEGRGAGASKKAAETAAAKELLQILTEGTTL